MKTIPVDTRGNEVNTERKGRGPKLKRGWMTSKAKEDDDWPQEERRSRRGSGRWQAVD